VSKWETLDRMIYDRNLLNELNCGMKKKELQSYQVHNFSNVIKSVERNLPELMKKSLNWNKDLQMRAATVIKEIESELKEANAMLTGVS